MTIMADASYPRHSPGKMSVAADAEYAVAATKVFGIPELLELILIDVARSEIDFQSGPTFIQSPFVLRAVNRDFQNTIDGSARLLSLRFDTQHDDPTWAEGYVSGPEFGPLFWLETMTGLDCNFFSEVEDGVLHIRLLFHAIDHIPAMKIRAARESKRMKLRKDLQGSWRKTPCVPKRKDVSRVMLHFKCSAKTEDNISYFAICNPVILGRRRRWDCFWI
ncbi:hypothetical protein CB0940_09213 [Cercospora beticola]|uniref:Uncharacterized protein n=2 Tax=Cercospora beticola TaxID=122368 RepID=A0A2G5HGW3_CERBT|nr:hypothetical protein CB0940_09213 [Cercospora beticola]PIA91483.1 hypothetical protein CB0940_09213 [Cercospora beticola]